MIIFLFNIILLISLPLSSESCSCVEIRTEKEGYCTTSWISKVKILSKENSGLGFFMAYRLEHINVIKAPDNTTLPEIMNTSTQESACGQTGFKVGKEYILGGSLHDDDSLFITFCNWRVPLKYIDEKKLELKPSWQKFVESVGTCPSPPTNLL